MLFLNDFYLVLPEIYLLISILSIILLTVTYTSESISIGTLLGIQIGYISLGVIGNLALLYYNMGDICYELLGTTFVSSSLSKCFLVVILIGLFCIVGLGIDYMKENSLQDAEIYIILLIVLLGFIVVIFCNDFLSLYLGIELQSLGLYILATLKKNSIYATEAGVKYFILGSVASCLLILGISIIYSITGVISFNELYLLTVFVLDMPMQTMGCLIGLVLILTSLLFKVGAAPVHSWLPDVYEGVSTYVTAFFVLVPKITIFFLLIKIFYMFSFIYVLHYIIILSSFLSIIIGSIGALYQVTIKRLLSYSAIGHTGYILVGLVISNLEGVTSLLFYIVIYFLIILNVVGNILQLYKKDSGISLKFIQNFGYIYKNNKLIGASLILIFFSLAGIPPLSGFYSKFLLLIGLINKQYYLFALILLLCSVISCVYYLKVIRNIIIIKDKKKNYLLMSVKTISAYIIMWSLCLNMFFIIFCNSIMIWCYTNALNFLY